MMGNPRSIFYLLHTKAQTSFIIFFFILKHSKRAVDYYHDMCATTAHLSCHVIIQVHRSQSCVGCLRCVGAVPSLEARMLPFSTMKAGSQLGGSQVSSSLDVSGHGIFNNWDLSSFNLWRAANGITSNILGVS